MNNRISLLVLLVISFLFLGFDTWAYPLFAPDEPRYAETAKEFMETGSLIVPFCDYQPRYDKPILFYWFITFAYKIFGTTEFATRLPSVLAGTGMVCLSFLLANIHGFPITAGIIMLSSLAVFFLSKFALTDMVLAFFMSAALVFFYLGYSKVFYRRSQFAFKERISSRWFASSLMMMGFGFLTKGPIALLLPLLIILLFLLFQKDLIDLIKNTWIDLSIGFLLIVIINLPWYLTVHLMTKGAFTKEFFLDHNLHRYLQLHSNHHGPIWYYIPVILLGFFPWSVFLIQALSSGDLSTKFNVQSEKARLSQTFYFCLIWLLTVLLFFSFAKTKLPTYILPIYLPMTFIVAAWWSEKYKTTKSNSYRNFDALYGLLFLLLLMIIGLALAATVFKPLLLKAVSKSLLMPIVLIVFILFAVTIIALTGILNQAMVTFGFIVSGTLLSLLIAQHFILRPMVKQKYNHAQSFLINLDPEAKIAVYKMHPTIYNFYAQKNRIDKLSIKDADSIEYIIVAKPDLDELTKKWNKQHPESSFAAAWQEIKKDSGFSLLGRQEEEIRQISSE